jgi:hypothetical protein
MIASHGILIHYGVDFYVIVLEVGVLESVRGLLWPLDLTTTTTLGSPRELCRSRGLGVLRDALRDACAWTSAFFCAPHAGGLTR